MGYSGGLHALECGPLGELWLVQRRDMKESDAIIKATPQHVEAVRQKVEEIRRGIAGRFIELGTLLGEIKDGGFHVIWGHANFGLWLKSSGLDLGESAAYYLIKIVRTSKQMGIPQEQLEKIKLSKLREICRLDPKTHSKQIKQLMDACTPDKDGNEMSLEDCRINVQKIEGGAEIGDNDTKIDLFVFLTIKVTTTQKQVIEDAVELVRAKHGDTMDADGNPAEISIGKAVELMAAEYLNGADEVEQEDMTVPVEGDEQCPTCQTGVHGKDGEEIFRQRQLPPAPEGYLDRPMELKDLVVDAEIVEPVENTTSTVENEPTSGPVVETEQEKIAKILDVPAEQVHKLDIQDGNLVKVIEENTRLLQASLPKIDVKAVEQRVAADLAAKDDDRDPLWDECKKIADEVFNDDTSAAVGALTFQREFRIGTARALKLFTDITGRK